MKTNNPIGLSRARSVLATVCGVAAWLITAGAAVAHPGHGDHDHDHEGLAVFTSAAGADTNVDSAISAETVGANQLDLAEVFSQPSILNSSANPYQGTPVRVDFNPVIEITNRPDLLNIENDSERQQLFNLTGSGVAGFNSDTLNVYYVDTIDACGSGPTNPLIVGCGSINGNDLIVEAAFAASTQGAELLAHEIGHNLGLQHVGNLGSTDNLLNPRLNGSTTLLANQVASLLANRRVNNDIINQELFITINPIVLGGLAAAAVPEPSAAASVAAAVGLMAGRRRRRR